MSTTESHGQRLVLIAAVLWGTTGTAQAFAPAGAEPFAVGAIRLAVGGAALLLVALARGAFRRARWPAVALFFAVGGMAAYQVTFFTGVARTGVAVGTIAGIGSAPIWGGIIGYLVRRERPGWRWAAATVLAILGCGLLIAGGESLQVDPLGVVLAMGAGLSYATYVAANKRLLEIHTPEAVMAVVFCLGALVLVPILFFADLRWLLQPRGLLVALHLGLVTVAVGYTLFARGLRTVPISTTVSLTLAEPLTAGLLGVLVLGERLTLLAGLGIGLLFGGLAVLTVMRAAGGRKMAVPAGDAHLGTMETVRAGYNVIASPYLASRPTGSADVQLLQDLVQRLPRGARVLDAGCGAGVPVTRLLSQYFAVTGVDFSTEQIRLARQLVPQAQFLCQDLTALELPDNSFDAICSYYAIIHIPRQAHRALLVNFYRMLKPSGLALLCMGADDLPEDVDESYFGERMVWSHYDAETNLQILRECGFDVLWSRIVADCTDPNAVHLFVLVQKGAADGRPR
jgi:DME family drug/metabolite transporter